MGSKVKLPRLLSQSLLAATLSLAGLLSGLVPTFSQSEPVLVFSYAAVAQNFSDEQITNYARTVLALEKDRQQAYAQIKSKIGNGNMPNIVCNQPQTINSLPENVRDIAENYCNQSKQIVQENGLTPAQFNEITINLQNNTALQQKIKNEMTRLQKSGQ